MSDFFQSSFGQSLVHWLLGPVLYILLVLLGSFVLVRVARYFLRRAESRLISDDEEIVPSEREKRAKALSGILSSLVAVIIYVIAIVIILDRLGVRTASILASIGVVGVAIGLGAQSLAKDFISGIFIMAESQFGVGDVIKVQATGGTVEGKVERMTLRATVLRGTDGEAQIVPNGEIRIVSNLSKEWARAVLDIPVDHDNVAEAITAIREAGHSLATDPAWSDLLLTEPEVLGLEELGKDEATVRITVRTLPLKQWDVSRELRKRVVDAFAERGIVGQFD